MLNRPNRKPIVPVVVVLWVDSTTVEVQVASITSRVERSRPVVTVGATIVPRTTIAVARTSNEEYSVTALYDHQKESAKPSGIFDFSHHPT